MKMWFTVLGLCGLLLGLPVVSQAVQYQMVDLTTLPGAIFSYALGINNYGQIVGSSYDAGYNEHAILWQNGQATDLGLLPEFLGGPGMRATAINNHSQVVGWGETHGGHIYAFLWDNGALQNLGTTRAFDINDSGQVVGGGNLWQNGVLTSLGTAPGAAWSDFSDINNNGQLAGRSWYSGAGLGACLWQDGLFTYLGPGAASDINDIGQAVGNRTDPSGAEHVYLWQDGTTTDLGPGSACAINNHGWVCGWSSGNAVVWADGEMMELGPGNAFDINDNGWVCGESAESRAVVWIPVPEPSSILALICGLAGWCRMVRRRSA